MATTPKELSVHLEEAISGKKLNPILEQGLNSVIAQLRDGVDTNGNAVDYAAVRKTVLDLAGKAKVYGEGMISRELKTAAKIIQVFQFTL